MGALVRLIALRDARARLGRSALAASGIALGVALVLAMQLINGASVAALRQAVEAGAGRAELEVVATSDAGVPEDALDVVRGVPGVAVAVPFIEGPALVEDGRGESLTIFGVDLGDEPALHALQGLAADAQAVIDDPLVFLAQPDSLIVTRAFAAARGLGTDARVPVAATGGRRRLAIRGLLEPRGAARAYGSGLGIMDVFAAQRLLGRDGRYDRIAVVLADGAEIAAVTASLRRALPPALDVERPEQRGEQVTTMLRASQAMLASVASIALVVALFIIYNSLATVVVERRTEIGILRALGTRRREILGLWLVEAAVTGAVGAAAGTALGLGLAHLLVAVVSRATAIGFGLPPLAYHVQPSTPALAIGLAAGIAASLVAALLPARSAAHVRPLEAIREPAPPLPQGWGARAFAAGVACAGVAALALAAVGPGSVAAGYVANVALCVAVALLSVPAVLLSRHVVQPFAARLLGVWGHLAGDASRRTPVRTATTVAALALGLTMSTTLAVVTRSFEDSVDEWVHAAARKDLYVRSAFKERGYGPAPFADDVARIIAGVPGVASVERFRVIRLRHGNDTIALAASSRPDLGGREAWISDNFALRFRTKVGDRVPIDTPRGRRRFPVTRIQRDYNSDKGTVTVSLRAFRHLWGDTLVSELGIAVVPGAAPASVRADVLRRAGVEHAIQIFDPASVAAEIRSGVSRAFAFTTGLDAVTLLVAFLGIFDTVLAGVLARRREIGMLRALGFRRRDVAATFALEGVIIGLLGAALGLAAGLVLSVVQIRVVFPYALGYLVEVHAPALRLGAVAVSALALALAAAALPARRAAYLHVTEALARD
jgi:putative ABC transport system permease protein